MIARSFTTFCMCLFIAASFVGCGSYENDGSLSNDEIGQASGTVAEGMSSYDYGYESGSCGGFETDWQNFFAEKNMTRYVCSGCEGKGLIYCLNCDTRGWVRPASATSNVVSQLMDMVKSEKIVCTYCDGKGHLGKCSKCKGTGDHQ